MYLSNFDQDILDNIVKDPSLDVYQYSPFRDGSDREVLPDQHKMHFLKISAPWAARALASEFHSGSKKTPMDVILRVPTAEGQYGALCMWYKLLKVDRPSFDAHLKPEIRTRVAELRFSGMKLKDISALTGLSMKRVSMISKSLGVASNYGKYNAKSLQIYGRKFGNLPETKRRLIRKLVNGDV